jgi:hypothetical protein
MPLLTKEELSDLHEKRKEKHFYNLFENATPKYSKRLTRCASIYYLETEDSKRRSKQ